MPSCSVKWCSNHTSTCSLKLKNGVSFHRFPKDEATCKKWVEAVRFERRDPWWTSSNASRICSIHFKESDISSTPCKVNILAKTAVPVCTMIWYNENENKVTIKTSIANLNTDNTTLKTYERKKTSINEFKEDKKMSKIHGNIKSKMTLCPLFQDDLPQTTKLLKTLEGSKAINIKEGLEPNSITNVCLKPNTNLNVTAVQKKSVLTELNKQEYVQSCTDKCCKTEIIVKLNDNTNLILDKDLNNDGETIFKEYNKVSKELNTKMWDNSKKGNLKELKSNENKEPHQEVNNNSNSDIIIETIANNIVNNSKSFVGKMLKTYLPKRKDKINEKSIKETCKIRNKNKDTLTDTVKCKEVNYSNVDKHSKDNLNKKLNTGMPSKTNLMADLQSNKSSQEIKNLCAFKSIKKNIFKRKSKFFDGPKIRKQKKTTVGLLDIDANRESNMTHIDQLITNQSRIDNIKETNRAVYDEIISELFETSKNVGNISETSSNGNHQETNENSMNSALDKETNNMHLNNLMDLELSNVVNSGLNNSINTDKTAIHASFIQFTENIPIESNQPLSIMNKNMPMEQSDYMISESHHNLNTEIYRDIGKQWNNGLCYNESISNNSILLSDNDLQNLETSAVKNIISETKTVEFTELKKHLSMTPKLDFPSKLCTNSLKDVGKDNIQVQGKEYNAQFDKNTVIAVNNLVTSLRSNFNTDATKETDPNVTNFKQSNCISLEEFITSSESNNSENIDSITNFNTASSTTREPKFNKLIISDINIECKKTRDKDMPDLNSVMDLELCSEMKIGCTDESNNIFNTGITDINADFDQYNDNKATSSNQLLPIMNKNILMEHSDHMISESHTEMNGNITTQGNRDVYNENISNDAVILSKNDLHSKISIVNNIVNETKKDKFTELKTHLSIKPKFDSHSELCTNILRDTDKSLYLKYDSNMSTAIIKKNIQVSDQEHDAEYYKKLSIDVNDIVTSIQSNTNNDTTREIESNVISSKHCNSILDEELIKNISPETNNNKNVNAINNLIIDSIKTMPTLNKNIISDNNVGTFSEKNMPELNTVIFSELNDGQIPNLKEDFHILNKEMLDNKDLPHRKSDKDFVNVLTMSDDQHTVVNEHMDVVNNILNRDIAEFDLSLLLSDTPIPDEEIQNVDNNSNFNSLDGIGGSPNWIHLPTGEMPKIIDDILDQDSNFLENLDLFDKDNKFNLDKGAHKKDNEIKKMDKEKYLTSKVGQYDKNVINNFSDTGKQCAKISIAEIEKELIAEFSDCKETSLEQKNNIRNENKVSQSKKIKAEKSYVLRDEKTDKQILEQYLQPNNEQCNKNNVNQVVDKCNEHSDKEILYGNKPVSQCRNQDNFDSKTNQIDDSSINNFFGPYLDQSEKSFKEQDGLGIENSNDEVLKDVDILELSKKLYDKQSNNQTYQTRVGELTTIEESNPKSKILNHDIFGSNELNIGKLKRVIFEECYDSECLNNCKHQIHNSNTQSRKKARHINQSNYTPYDALNKQQYKKNSIDNFNNQLDEESIEQNLKHKKDFLERHKLSHNVKYKTKYKKIAIDQIPGQYLELRWKESLGKPNAISQEGCKRKYNDLGLDRRKILCSESTNKFSTQTMAECPECGYTTDDNDLMNYQSDVDLRITKPLSLINKDMLISLRDMETENNNLNNRVELQSVYAMELAYITAIQALERKLKQKNAISEYRLRKVDNLRNINNKLINAFFREYKV